MVSEFIKVELPRGGSAILNVDDIACAFDMETYSNGRSVVIRLRSGREIDIPRMTVADVERLIAVARKPNERG